MLIHINKRTSIQWNKVEVLHYKQVENITLFKVGSEWLTGKGDWTTKIEKALQVGAVAVYKSHYVLRA